MLENYLAEKKQYVHIGGFDSNRLDVGPQSVIQGSTLSCTLYLIYILDMSMMFHQQKHTPKEQIDCKRENQKTFVDDNSILVKTNGAQNLSEAVELTMQKVQIYMQSNLLELNPSKTTTMVISKDKATRVNFSVTLGGKTVTHSKSLRLLGNIITEDLSWENKSQMSSSHL